MLPGYYGGGSEVLRSAGMALCGVGRFPGLLGMPAGRLRPEAVMCVTLDCTEGQVFMYHTGRGSI